MGGVRIWSEGQSDEQITAQGQTGVPAQDLGGGGTVESDRARNLEDPG